MKAPARSIQGGQLLSFFEVQAGRKVYRQIDDELLAAFEADVQGEVKMGGSLGMMIARIREAEKDRDALQQAISAMNTERDCYAATRDFWPLSLREAIQKGDVEACRADGQRTKAFQLDVLSRMHAAEALANKLGEACEVFKARIEELETQLATTKEKP